MIKFKNFEMFSKLLQFDDCIVCWSVEKLATANRIKIFMNASGLELCVYRE